MSGARHAAVFATAVGPCGIVWRADDDVIVGVHLPEVDAATTARRMRRRFPTATTAPPSAAVAIVIERIRGLLGGGGDDLADVAVDLEPMGEFERSVYAVARAVPPGSTLTYGEVATRLGSPGLARAVGQALGRNPVPIIVPCHRVLAAGGAMGGFSANGGVDTKRRLLFIEGAIDAEPLRLFDQG